MKKLLALLTAIVAGVSALYAQTVVTTDAEIRAAIQVNNANIQLGADINLSNSTLRGGWGGAGGGLVNDDHLGTVSNPIVPAFVKAK